MRITRREFFGTAAAGVAASSMFASTKPLPERVLGRTGARVTILAFGTGSRWLSYKDEDKALAVLNRALDLGINYIDTAANYGDGTSEQWIGKLMRTRRKDVFLATKVLPRKADDAMRTVEGSLKRLDTGYLDLLHVHSLEGGQDLAAIEAPNGVLNLLYKLREQKIARAIGITSHTDPAALKTALERHDFDCVQMALNAALAGMTNVGNFGMNPMARTESFEGLALPVATRKNMGIIAMKVFAQDFLSGKAPADKLLRYAMSLPVTTASVGMPKPGHLEHNAELARNFKPLPESEMRELSRSLSAGHKAAIDRFFLRHMDA